MFKRIFDKDEHGSIENREKLMRCPNSVVIGINNTNIEQCKNQIQYFEYKIVNYRIELTFRYNASLDQKIKLIDIIDEIQVNHKVGEVWIEINDENPFSVDFIESINKRYKNLYHIWIIDKSLNINQEIHNGLKKLI